MFKAVLLVAFVALFATLASAATCPVAQLNCLEVGASCNATLSQCENSVCTGYTGIANGTCTAWVAENGTCSQATAYTCAPGLACVSDKCIQAAFAQNGEFCAVDGNCAFGLKCNSSVCSFPSGFCQTDNQCPQGQSCNMTNPAEGACVASYAVGADCSKAGSSCITGSLCVNFNENSTICVALVSQAAGANCTGQESYFTTCDISQNLYCNDKNLCDTIPAFSPANTKCSKDSDCKTLEVCDCSSGANGICQATVPNTNETLTECKEAVQAYFTCLNTNKCRQVSGAENKESCIAKNCESETCDLSKCSIEVELPSTECENVESINTFTCESSAAALKASIMFALVAAFALLF